MQLLYEEFVNNEKYQVFKFLLDFTLRQQFTSKYEVKPAVELFIHKKWISNTQQSLVIEWLEIIFNVMMTLL